MRKLDIILALIAALIGIVFSASVLAAPPIRPAGEDVLMEADLGYVENFNEGRIIGNFSYPDVAHVSVTLRAEGIDAADIVYLRIHFPIPQGSESVDAVSLENGVANLQFDAAAWDVVVDLNTASNINLQYYWTATYPNPK